MATKIVISAIVYGEKRVFRKKLEKSKLNVAN